MPDNNPFAVDTFIKHVQGGARPYLFAVFPVDGGNLTRIAASIGGLAAAATGGAGVLAGALSVLDGVDIIGSALGGVDFMMLVKASAFPSSSISSTETKFRGRVANITGERTFGDWKVTMWNTPTHASRGYMENWHNKISGAASNLRPISSDYNAIYKDFIVVQLSTLGIPTAAIRISGGWPSEIGEISLDNESSGIETFDTTFKYQYWTRVDLNTLTDTGVAPIVDTVARISNNLTF